MRHGGTLCFPLCADTDTSQQSPIDIQINAVTPDPTLPTLAFSYSTTTVNVTDGPTISPPIIPPVATIPSPTKVLRTTWNFAGPVSP
jgi:hypothetical protein